MTALITRPLTLDTEITSPERSNGKNTVHPAERREHYYIKMCGLRWLTIVRILYYCNVTVHKKKHMYINYPAQYQYTVFYIR